MCIRCLIGYQNIKGICNINNCINIFQDKCLNCTKGYKLSKIGLCELITCLSFDK
jgi:hypothetical protein